MDKENRKGEDLIVLRSVYGKVGIKYHIQPCRDPKTKKFAPGVKMIDSNGNMILTDEERNKNLPVVSVDDVFVIEDGHTFDLTDPWQALQWEAIRHCPLIAQHRYEKDENGVYKIDGAKPMNNAPRYGKAELYVERPHQETNARISNREKIHNAESFIFSDSAEHRLLVAKVLGKRMKHAPDPDVKDYLLEIAAKDPDKIIKLYTGDDLNLRTLFVDARDKGIIHSKGGVYMYGDGTVLGSTIDNVISWMRDFRNKKLLEIIQTEVHPEHFEITNPNAKIKAKDKA